ncbi:glycoside hydrolase family 19 protein [Phreatobacter stygius]|uniref:glycoside hydrolase family 19 protein n=1 Tax=Phreatobacter stygius TaxID=1940610 RepID=UPI001C0776A5|nr:glycoside hydrolase family 19 protein [Phreatobacter stygius]
MTITVTAATLRRIAPDARSDIILHLAPALTAGFPAGGITSPARAAHFLAQAAHETDGFRTLVEYGDAAYFRRYDGRRDLGNVQAGDGARYRGRGIFQLTGRANYRSFGAKIGVNLEGLPEAAALPANSTATALAYWNDRALSAHADRDDLRCITRRINGGFNGLADREARLIRAKAALSGQPASAAVNEITTRATQGKRAATRAAAGAGGAATAGTAGTATTVAPKAETSADGSPIAAGIVLALVFGGAFVVLAGRAWSKGRQARAFRANAAQGAGA